LMMDMSKLESLKFLTGPVYSIIERGFALRWGVVPIFDDTDEGEGSDAKKMARLFYYLIHNLGRKRTMGFIGMVCFSASSCIFVYSYFISGI
jgi:hypothetical protein